MRAANVAGVTPPRAYLRLACALGAALVAVVVAGAPALALAPSTAPSTAASPAAAAAAAGGTDALTPFVDCVQDAPLGVVTARTAVLGYRSTASAPVTVPAGAGANDVSSGAADRGQPSTFRPGEHHGAWLLTVDAAAEPSLTWSLGAASATIDGSAPTCTDATAVSVTAPATVSSPGTIAVSAAVTRFLLAPPDAGTITFAFDGVPAATVAVGPDGTGRADLATPTAGTHSLTAAFAPADGSTLKSATATSAVDVVAASGPLSVDADSVVSGSTSARILVTRGNPSGTATVDFATVDGTARSGADFVATSGSVVLADGRSTATASIPLAARAPGSPAAVFFVVLKRASTGVDGAVAVVSLPAVPAQPSTSGAATGGGAGGTGSSGPDSSLPGADPTAHVPVVAAPVGHDPLLLLGATLVTAGGIAGVIGLFRSVRSRGAFS